MKRLLALSLPLLMQLAGCSAEIADYRQQQPTLDIFQYFQGETQAWGMVQDRSGKQLRRFHVDINGDVVGDTLTLNERFVYDDGEKQQRVWHIRKVSADRYEGTAGDIEGVAKGQAAGNAFNWHYSMNVKASGRTWLLNFDDWMYLQDANHLFNKTEMKKFGVTVGTVTLFFSVKRTSEEDAMKMQPIVGISGCLTGSAVRFDGGHKRAEFVMDRLAQWVTFRPICPEMAIGLPVPRPALRLVQTAVGDIRMRFSHAPHEDVTDKMADFCQRYLAGLDTLSGFIVCAKSPSCGMERVRLYDEKGNRGRKDGVGLFTATLMEKYPWLPVEEDGRLHDPVLRENFVERVFALHELNTLRKNGLTRHALLDFHSRYKLQLLAHHQAGYREIGPFVASLHEWEDLEAFFAVYRDKLMTILKKPASRKNHTNVLMHIQGYFRNQLTMRQRGELREVILNYRAGLLPILAPMTLLKHYLAEYPDGYLLTQNYFDPYPQDLALRLTVN